MIRTQVSLEPQEYKEAKREAKMRGLSLAALLRESLRSTVTRDATKPWMQYAGLVDSNDPDASRNIDEVVYGGRP